MRILVSGATATVHRLAQKSPRYADRLGYLATPQAGNNWAQQLTGGTSSMPWAADNSAFSNPDDEKFQRMVWREWAEWSRFNPADWVAVPDVVGDHEATLELFHGWVAEWVEEYGYCPVPLAFVLQDGCMVEGVPWDQIDAVFVGGSTDWKLGGEAAEICREAKRRGKKVHVGRVNTLGRLRYAAEEMQADTVDGTNFSRFAEVKLQRALDYLVELDQQKTLF